MKFLATAIVSSVGFKEMLPSGLIIEIFKNIKGKNRPNVEHHILF